MRLVGMQTSLSYKERFHCTNILPTGISECRFSIGRRNILNLIILSSQFVWVRMVISVMLGHLVVWAITFFWNIFGCGKAISLTWGLNSAPPVSHASLLATRPCNPSKVLSAIRVWAENCGFCPSNFHQRFYKTRLASCFSFSVFLCSGAHVLVSSG